MKKTNGNINQQALGCKVSRAYQIMLSKLATTLSEAGLNISTSDYLVLRAVYTYPGAQQCEISDLVGKDKAAVSRVVAGLEKRGLLKTESVSYKCRRVFPTEMARQIEPRIMEVAAKRHQTLSDITTPAELEIFNNVLDKIIQFKSL